MVRRMMLFFVILSAALALLHASLLIVNTHQYAVLYRSNTMDRIIDQPGIYLKWPGFLQKVYMLDGRILTSVGETAQHPLTTGDQRTLMATWYVQWRISDPKQYAYKFGYRDTVIKNTLHETIRNRLQAILKAEQHDAVYWLGSARPRLDKRLQQEVQNIANTQKWGLRLQAIRLIRLDISPDAMQRVQAEMLQTIHTRKKQLETNMQKELGQLKAANTREYNNILDQAHQEAAHIRAQGEAAAIEIYTKDYAKSPSLAKYLQTLSLYQHTFNQPQDAIVLNPEKDGLFSQLYSGPNHSNSDAIQDTKPPIKKDEYGR